MSKVMLEEKPNCTKLLITRQIVEKIISYVFFFKMLQPGQHRQHRRAVVQGHAGVRVSADPGKSADPEEHHPNVRKD